MNNKQEEKSITGSIYRAYKNFFMITPILLGVVLILGLFRTLLSKEIISSIFTGQWLLDTLIGSFIGSISAGNSVTSYIIGGELLNEGVSLFAVTSFIVAWVTVGVIQFPLEAATLGRRFALYRNLFSFILSVLVAIASVATLMVMR